MNYMIFKLTNYLMKPSLWWEKNMQVYYRTKQHTRPDFVTTRVLQYDVIKAVKLNYYQAIYYYLQYNDLIRKNNQFSSQFHDTYQRAQLRNCKTNATIKNDITCTTETSQNHHKYMRIGHKQAFFSLVDGSLMLFRRM